MNKNFSLIVVLIIILGALSWFLYSKETKKQIVSVPEQFTEEPILHQTFSDALINPTTSREFNLDEYGAGISELDTFNIDDLEITRARVENGTDHFYYDYKIYLNGFDITPAGFRTTEGAECALTKLQFNFTPEFSVIKISRPWEESWITPTVATRVVYNLQNGKLVPSAPRQLRAVCDVSELF